MKHLISYSLIAGILFFSLPLNSAQASKGLNINSSQVTGMGAKHKQVTQPTNQSPKLPTKHLRRIDWVDKLDLSKAQEAQVQEIYKSSQPEVDNLILQMHQLHQKVAEIYKEDDLKIRKILDEQQQIKFDKEQRKMQKRRGDRTTMPKPSRKRMPQF